ncbi:MAG: ABC transporter permease [Myxococcota bacterium]
MSVWAIFKVAVRALGRNLMRSILTALGIVIGVTAVIAMVAVGAGAQTKLNAIFDAMGTNMLIIQSGSARSAGVAGGSGSAQTLTWADLEAIRNNATAAKYLAPVLTTRGVVASDIANWSTSITGSTREFFGIRNWSITRGDTFTDEMEQGGQKVLIIGATVATQLFGADDPVGQVVRVKNVPFQVVGMLAPKGQAPNGADLDDVVFMPAKAFQQKIQGGLGAILNGAIYLGTDDAESTSRAQTQVEAVLRDRHRVADGEEEDFRIRNMAEQADSRQQAMTLITTLLAAIAGVSLVVGGIGVMNIMLVSVVERTREIGIRMAVGARPLDIMVQFLAESLVLSGIGGALGLGIGAAVAKILASSMQWEFLFPAETALVAIAVSGGVGVVFGLYPAVKASGLDPIVALRVET